VFWCYICVEEERKGGVNRRRERFQRTDVQARRMECQRTELDRDD
jgi:hypothetical protein